MTAIDDFSFSTTGRGFFELTDRIARAVAESGVKDGLCNVFVHHTSASLILCENADPSVLDDLEGWMSRAVRERDPSFTHIYEGADDMPSHIRSVLTCSSITIPVRNRAPALGTWQGIFLWEHRNRPHRRMISVTVQG